MSTDAKTYSGTSLGGYQCYDPDQLAEELDGDDPFLTRDWMSRANCYINPLGPTPGRGWCLMKRADVQALFKTQNDNWPVSELDDSPQPGAGNFDFAMNGQLILTQAVVIRASGMTHGLDSQESIMLVEFSDGRYPASHGHGGSALNMAVNVRLRCPPTATRDMSDVNEFSEPSLSPSSGGGGANTVWTWQDFVNAIFSGAVPTGGSPVWGVSLFSVPQVYFANEGTALTLPYSPHGYPENFRFIWKGGWEALHLVLHRIGCTTSFDPATATIKVVRLGAAQQDLSAAQAGLAGRLMVDYQMLDDPSLRVGGTPRVVFPFELYGYGTEADFDRSGNSGSGAGMQSHDVQLPVTETVDDEGVLVINQTAEFWQQIYDSEDGMPTTAVFDEATAIGDIATDGSFTWKNETYIEARATERATNFKNIREISDLPMRQVYSGAQVAFKPGSQVKAVVFRNLADSQGEVTEVLCFPRLLRDPITRTPGLQDALGYAEPDLMSESEMWQPPDLARNTYMVWPHRVQIVLNNGDGTGTLQPSGGHFQAAGNCYLNFLNGTGTNGRTYIGVLSGMKTGGSGTMPVFSTQG